MNAATKILTLVVVAVMAAPTLGGPLFQASYDPVITFQDAGLEQHPMGITHDGAYYWSCSGGATGGLREAQYDGTTGALIATYASGLDYRSIFTPGGGTVYARAFASNVIYKQTAPGVFAPSGVTLNGGSLDDQSSVVWDSRSNCVAQYQGVVSRWDGNGTYLGAVTLQGYGSIGGEDTYPANCRLAAWSDYWLTYSNGTLSAWDQAGNRVDMTTLNGAGAGTDSHWSFSVAKNMVFVVDDPGRLWRGYNIPEPASLSLLAAGGLLALIRRRPARRA